MSEASIARINEAIKACLVACYESELPLARLKEFLDRLDADSTFNEKEVLIVNARVRSMLSMMFKRSEGGALLPIIPTDPEYQVQATSYAAIGSRSAVVRTDFNDCDESPR